MKYSLVACLLLLFLISCKSNYTKVGRKNSNYIPYYLKVYEADSLYQTNNFESAYQILDSLFKKYTPLNMENYSEYGIYIGSGVMSGHTEKMDEKVKIAISNYGSLFASHKNIQSIYDSIMKYSHLTKEQGASYKKEYSKTINLELRRRVQLMEDDDQRVRNMTDFEGMEFYTQKHKKEIEEIISKYGYPSYKVIGNNGYSDSIPNPNGPIMFKTVFLHQEIEVQKKYLPMLFSGIREGKILPGEYAQIYDKYLIGKTFEEGGKQLQLYGSFPGYELTNPKKIDSIRKSIGLPRLGYEEWSYNQMFATK